MLRRTALTLSTLSVVLALVSAAHAQSGDNRLLTAGDALDARTCQEVGKRVKDRIEEWTRMQYRRNVPVNVQPKQVWERNIKRGGVAGHNARSGLAFYNIISNQITVVPWVIGRYAGNKNPPKKYRRATLVPESHYRDREGNNPAPGPVSVRQIYHGFYNCTMCHAPQKDAKPLVENVFKGD